jgi:hypothetical protein
MECHPKVLAESESPKPGVRVFLDAELQPTLDPERSENGSPSVVLVCTWNAEEGHNAVAQNCTDATSISANFVCGLRQHAMHHVQRSLCSNLLLEAG